MKYQCEVCGAIFENLAVCNEHEQKCREHYEGLLYVVNELNVLIGAAKSRGISLGVEIPVLEEDKPNTVFYTINKVDFKADKNKIILEPESKDISLIVKPNEDKDAKKSKK